MVHSLTKTITFEEFIAWYPDSGGRYELHDGMMLNLYSHYKLFKSRSINHDAIHTSINIIDYSKFIFPADFVKNKRLIIKNILKFSISLCKVYV
jgi:hypothetical protein